MQLAQRCTMRSISNTLIASGIVIATNSLLGGIIHQPIHDHAVHGHTGLATGLFRGS